MDVVYREDIVKELVISVDYYPENPREDYDHIAEFQQLNSDCVEIDDIGLSEALCAADILTCSRRYGCQGDHTEWGHRRGQHGAEKILARHIRMFYPDIVWHGMLHKNGYSQGQTVEVYAIVTKQNMSEVGITPDDITWNKGKEIAESEFEEYAAYSFGDVFIAEYDGDAIGGLIGSEESEIVARAKEHFGIN